MYIFFSIFLQWFTVLEISLSNDSVSFLSCNRHLMESRLLFAHSQYPFPHPTYSLLFIYWHEILTTILSSSHTTTRTFCNSCYPELIFHFPEKCCTVSSYRHQFLLTPLFFFFILQRFGKNMSQHNSNQRSLRNSIPCISLTKGSIFVTLQFHADMPT